MINPDVVPEKLAQHSEIGRVLEQLDAIGFNISDTRISVLTVCIVVVVLIGVFVFARLGNKLAHIVFSRLGRLDKAQQVLGEKLVSIMIWALAILIGIDMLGIDLTALTVFSGAFGLAIGFGLQKTFGNLIAGIILLMDRSIKPGDVISVNDASGRESFGQVKKIGIRAVSVTTRDKREYLIPNENLMINQVENWSYSSREVRMQVHVGVAYGADMERAEQLMLEAANASKRVLSEPAPTVWMSNYGDNAVEFVIHCWITDPEEGVGNVRSDVLKTLWKLFAENGIEIPFPQRDINLRDNAALRELIAALREAP